MVAIDCYHRLEPMWTVALWLTCCSISCLLKLAFKDDDHHHPTRAILQAISIPIVIGAPDRVKRRRRRRGIISASPHFDCSNLGCFIRKTLVLVPSDLSALNSTFFTSRRRGPSHLESWRVEYYTEYGVA